MPCTHQATEEQREDKDDDKAEAEPRRAAHPCHICRHTMHDMNGCVWETGRKIKRRCLWWVGGSVGDGGWWLVAEDTMDGGIVGK